MNLATNAARVRAGGARHFRRTEERNSFRSLFAGLCLKNAILAGVDGQAQESMGKLRIFWEGRFCPKNLLTRWIVHSPGDAIFNHLWEAMPGSFQASEHHQSEGKSRDESDYGK
jgi:hypothetical protein